MTEPRTAQEIAEEAERILASEVFMAALKRMEDTALEALLSASGPDADTTRRENADLMKAIRAIPRAIRFEMLAAQKMLKPRGGVA